MQSLLTVRLGAMGDVVLTTGVLRYWHETRNEQFHVLTKAAFVPLFAHHPAIERVIGLQKDELHPPALLRRWQQLAQEYKQCTLIDLHSNLRTRLLSLLWHGTVLRYPKQGFRRRTFLLSHGRFFKNSLLEHTVTQRYALTRETMPPKTENLLPQLYLTKEEQQKAYALLHERVPQCTTQPFVALHPYATHNNKMWPTAAWHALTKILDQQGIPWIVLGQTANTAIHHQQQWLCTQKNDLTNQTDLRETCALLSLASVLVTGDSGPMHLASAVGTPVVALFGPTTREWGFFPQGKNDRVLETTTALPCRPCSLHGKKACPHHGECLRSISHTRVFLEIMDLLHSTTRDN